MSDTKDLTQEEKDLIALIEKNVEAAMGEASKKEAENLRKELNTKITEIKNTMNYESVQKQLDALFERTDRIGKPVNQKQADEKERELTSKWLRKFLKKDNEGLREVAKEYKDYLAYFEPSLHTGQTDYPSATALQGEYTIPHLLLAEIHRFVFEAGVARREMRYLPFSGPGNERDLLPLATTVTLSWIGEGDVKPKTKPTIDKVVQKLHKLAAIVVMTEEIVEDSAIDLIGLCAELFGEAIAIEEDRVFLSGDVGAGDPVNGVINAAGVVVTPMAAGLTPGDITPDILNNLIYSIPTPARRGAKYYMHPEIFSFIQTYRADAVAAGDQAGNYLVQTPITGGPSTLWGYPIVLTDELPAPGDVAFNEPFMFFANLQKTCVYGDKQGMRVKMLTEASITNAAGALVNLAENDLLAMRVHKRVGYVPVLPAGIAVLSTGDAT
jgi:HK97 family phage major capsid protein